MIYSFCSIKLILDTTNIEAGLFTVIAPENAAFVIV